jgi:mono/diheme cytochrome c family protein
MFETGSIAGPAGEKEMSEPFEADRLKNEKPEPIEAASRKFLFVPVILISMFIGFGATYLGFTTRNTKVAGDGRPVAGETPAGSGPELARDDGAEKGKQIFTTTCQACHQATGLGIPNAFPPLAGSEWVLGSPERMAAIILSGLNKEITVKGQKFRGAMPSWKEKLSDEEVAAVATYARRAWGNSASRVEPDLVKKIRERVQSRATPWAGEAELNREKWE